MTTSQLRKPTWMTELSGENLLTEEIIRERTKNITPNNTFEEFFTAALLDCVFARGILKYRNVQICFNIDAIFSSLPNRTFAEKHEALITWLLKKLKTHGLLHDPQDTIKVINPCPTYQDIVDLFVL